MARLVEVELKAVFAGLELELLSPQAALGLLLQLNQQENKPRRSRTPEAPPALLPWQSQRARESAQTHIYTCVSVQQRAALAAHSCSVWTADGQNPQDGKPTDKVPGTTAATCSVQLARLFRSLPSTEQADGGLNLHQRQRRDQVLQVVPESQEDGTVWDRLDAPGGEHESARCCVQRGSCTSAASALTC